MHISFKAEFSSFIKSELLNSIISLITDQHTPIYHLQKELKARVR